MQIPIRKSFFSALVLSWLLVVAVAVRADEVPYSPDLPTNTVCLVQIAQLHPTQFALGLKEVEERAEKFKALKEAKREAYLHKHIAPIAIGPGGIPYILDGQHLARIVLESGAKPEMYVEVKQNWAKLSAAEFWAKMAEHNYLYLRDENGKGPLDPALLPKTIAAMKDDPYRTLAWLVRSKGGYEKTTTLYADFQWAEYFRARVPVDNGSNTLDKAAVAALPIAHLADAQKLPGYSATPVVGSKD